MPEESKEQDIGFSSSTRAGIGTEGSVLYSSRENNYGGFSPVTFREASVEIFFGGYVMSKISETMHPYQDIELLSLAGPGTPYVLPAHVPLWFVFMRMS